MTKYLAKYEVEERDKDKSRNSTLPLLHPHSIGSAWNAYVNRHACDVRYSGGGWRCDGGRRGGGGSGRRRRHCQQLESRIRLLTLRRDACVIHVAHANSEVPRSA